MGFVYKVKSTIVDVFSSIQDRNISVIECWQQVMIISVCFFICC